MSDTADYTKHTDEQLREGIERADENARRIAAEGSDDQLEANREQRDAMEDELKGRES